MAIAQTSEAASIRARLSHPIIDADGHILELDPVIWQYMREIGGNKVVDNFLKYLGGGGTTGATMPHPDVLGSPDDHWYEFICCAQWASMSWKERRDSGTMVPFWWFLPTADTKYRATSHLPRLWHERMDEFGLDVSVLFPTLGVAVLALPGLFDDELRRVACRAYNTYVSDMYGEFSDRLIPAACIPMHTPQEALEELDFIKQRGLKAAMFPSYVLRPITREPGNQRIPEGRLAPWKFELFAIDSDYDYDPVWARCVELGVAPCFHSTANGIYWATRSSPSNLMYNTVGNFAESGDAIAKALFMGGVTRRFPTLRFGFLEGGIGRGALLYANMIGFWHKRNPEALRKYTDPRKLDLNLMSQLIDEYGNERVAGKKEEIMGMLGWLQQEGEPEGIPMDDWAGAKIERSEQFRELYEKNFYYGCEADDPTVAWAFQSNILPHGARLRPFMGSDISHADVLDPRDVVPEAHELLEHGILDEEQWKEFVFTNAVRLYGGMNPDFFKGTPVESAAANVLAEAPQGG